jgi:tripartite-type tricarboxylate transporter receptor subunit TctC
LLFAIAELIAGAGSGQANDNIADWKRLTIYIGTTTGGGNDAYVRLLARHIGDHLPGRPTVTPVNRPGAGGLSLINQMYASGAQDGSEIATVAPGFVMDRVLYGDKSHALFEPSRINWLGSLNRDISVFVVRNDKGITLSDIVAGKPINVGSPGPGGPPWFYSRALNVLMGAKMNVISGYPGMPEVLLGIANSELDGIAGVTWDTLKNTRAQWFASGYAKLILQYSEKRNAQLPDVPAVGELIQDSDAREAVLALTERDEISRPFFAPPNVPAERVDILRRAIDETTRDPQFQEDARRENLTIDFVTGEKAQALVARMSTPSPSVAHKLQDMFKD